DDIALRLKISQRSVYRYIDSFRSAGFVVKKHGNIIRLDKSSPAFRDLSELIHFTDEEAFILKSAIESIDENNLMKQNLKKKLYTVYDYKILADTVVNTQNGKNIKSLVQAIENKKKVVLHQYASGHSSDIRDRAVEAFAFTTNYIQVWCFDPSFHDHKLFSVSRIGWVEVLEEGWQYESKHQKGFLDDFRMHADQLLPVSLKLSVRAANLLCEEFPLAKSHLTKIDDSTWLYQAKVCSYDGVGRFVLGLMEEDVEIVESPEFVHFMRKKAEAVIKKIH
ncbi:MAG: WYL domain-containing protein, partial [Bacteroidia bacterium]|nr:WYL domain-containing protein [Bacteroidia bacterium]